MTGWRVHAGVLVGDHSHLLGEPPEANLGAGMQWLQNIYTLFDKSGRRPMVFFCQRDHFVVFLRGFVIRNLRFWNGNQKKRLELHAREQRLTMEGTRRAIFSKIIVGRWQNNCRERCRIIGDN